MELCQVLRYAGVCAVVAGTLSIAGCGSSGGLPGCDSSDAREIAKNALMKKLHYSEGYMCFMEDIGGFRPSPLNDSLADCHVAPNGRKFIPVQDLKFELSDYLVESEVRAADGLSMSCKISTKYSVKTKEQPQLGGKGGPVQMRLRYYGLTESGERRYDATF